MVRALKVVPAPTTDRERAPDLREQVDSAIAQMTWLTTSDNALVALAKRYAEEIETAIENAEMQADLYTEGKGDRSVYDRLAKLEAFCDVKKVVSTIGPQLQQVLRDLGGTPATRAAIANALKTNAPEKDRLKRLRGDADRSAG